MSRTAALDDQRVTDAETDAHTLAALLDELERTGLLLGVLPKAPEARQPGRYLILRSLHMRPNEPSRVPVLTLADTALEAVMWLESYKTEDACN